MSNLFIGWIGKKVHVHLHTSVPTSMEAILLAADATGIMLQMPKGRTFVPLTAILHISLSE